MKVACRPTERLGRQSRSWDLGRFLWGSNSEKRRGPAAGRLQRRAAPHAPRTTCWCCTSRTRRTAAPCAAAMDRSLRDAPPDGIERRATSCPTRRSPRGSRRRVPGSRQAEAVRVQPQSRARDGASSGPPRRQTARGGSSLARRALRCGGALHRAPRRPVHHRPEVRALPVSPGGLPR